MLCYYYYYQCYNQSSILLSFSVLTVLINSKAIQKVNFSFQCLNSLIIIIGKSLQIIKLSRVHPFSAATKLIKTAQPKYNNNYYYFFELKLVCKLINEDWGFQGKFWWKRILIVILLSEQVCKDGFQILGRCLSRLCNRNTKWTRTFALTMQITISKAENPLLQFFTGSLGIISFYYIRLQMNFNVSW